MCGWDENNPGNDGDDISVIPGSYRQNKERWGDDCPSLYDDDGHLFILICEYARDPHMVIQCALISLFHDW